MTLTVDAFAQLFDGVQVHAGPVIPGIHDFGHYHAWSGVYATYALVYLSDEVCGILRVVASQEYAIIGVIHDVVSYWMTLTWCRGTEGFCRILMRTSFAKCWKLVDASFDNASADLFSLRLICRILKEVNLDVSCRACSR
ncbi:hypothetical protein Hanom_Chr09g00852331 [Helianthus anomalus]